MTGRPSFLLSILPEIGCKVIAEIARIVAGAVNEGRFPAAQKLHPHEIQARVLDNTAIVTDHAFMVEDWYVEPRIVRTVPRSP
jgi:hypothetical protein